jgi:hypothetical protein
LTKVEIDLDLVQPSESSLACLTSLAKTYPFI